MEARLEEAQSQLDKANMNAAKLLGQLNSTTMSALSSSKSEKLPDPEPFNGKRDDLPSFVAGLRLKLLVNHDRYLTIRERLTYAFSRLTGSTKSQVLPFVTASSVNFDDVEALIAHLKLSFGDSDCKGTAQQQIQGLCQKNCEFSVYLAEFNRYVQDTEYNEEAMKSVLMTGLLEEMQKLLIHVNTQNMNLQQLISHCQGLDNRS